MKMATMLQMARSGDVRARLAAGRDGQAAVRVAAVGAGLRTGVLDQLQLSPEGLAALAERGRWSDEGILEALLRVLTGIGLVSESQGRWTLTRRGRAVLEDDVVRAMYEGFSDYHVGLYEEIERQLTSGPGRRDVLDKGDVIARLSRAMDPFVLEAVGKEVAQRRPRNVLDVGCGSGSHLVHMLRAAPGASGVGIETDASAAAMARSTLSAARLDGRAEVIEGDARSVLDLSVGDFDLALLANVIYYLPVDERVPLLRTVAEHMEPGGAVMVVTTALTDTTFSRHFDLLLRTQEGGGMGLPDIDLLCGQLHGAGLEPGKPRRIAPGEPLTAVVARRP